TPYDKTTSKAEGNYYAERGYVVVANDVRGRYASEGTWRLIVDDPQDGYDVVEWIARQEWSDGKVGTFGTSYPGGTQHALAELNPAPADDDGPDRLGVELWRQRDEARRCLRASVHELDLPDRRAQFQGGTGQPHAAPGPGRERPADPAARRQPAGP